jgi:adenylylsulfate kinase
MKEMKKAKVLWFTGLSGSGKTTIALSLKDVLESLNKNVKIFDGDDVRNTIHTKLGFSESDIKKNNLIVADLVLEAQSKYDFIIVPIISPYVLHRQIVRERIKQGFFEVYIKCSIERCIERDVKGLYKKALNGEINNMIGLAKENPYEAPLDPDIVIDTEKLSLEESISLLKNKLQV